MFGQGLHCRRSNNDQPYLTKSHNSVTIRQLNAVFAIDAAKRPPLIHFKRSGDTAKSSYNET